MRTQTTQLHRELPKPLTVSADKKKSRWIQCNLCDQRFSAHNKFERFCKTCKEGDDLYHFYETVPHFDAA